MANNSWNTPGLTKPIQEDVPHIQEKLAALLKQDPTSIENIPVGAKRFVEVSTGQWQFQQFDGSSWVLLKKLDMDVDTIDGYHAAITPNANTVAVRGTDKKLQGDITGNAATATSATTLSRTLPIGKGGTGATTSAAARTNLGAAPVAHASSAGTYGLATDTNYGHVRSDGTTTKIAAGEVVVKDVAVGGDTADTASLRGQIGPVLKYLDIDDFNDVTNAGCYFLSNTTASAAANRPAARGGFLIVEECQISTPFIRQIYFVYDKDLVYTRWKYNSTWSAWVSFILSTNIATTSAYGITKLTSAVNSTSEVLAATAKGLKIAYDKAVAAYNLADGIEVPIATTTKAGIVRPSTGLTIDAAGLLKVALNNTVTSTSTAQAATANAAKVAYDKAVAALNKANSAVSSGGKVTLRSTRKTKGTWTVTGLTVGKPLYVLHSSLADNIYNAYVNLSVISGSDDAIIAGSSLRYQIGRGTIGLPDVIVVVPTASSVSFNIINMVGNEGVNILRAYQ